MITKQEILNVSRKKLNKLITKKNYKRIYVFADMSGSVVADFDIEPTIEMICNVAKQHGFESIYIKPFSHELGKTITLYTAKANIEYIDKKLPKYYGGTAIKIVYDYIDKYIKNEDTLIIIISDLYFSLTEINNKTFLTADNIYYAYPNVAAFERYFTIKNIGTPITELSKLRPDFVKKLLFKKWFKTIL